MISALSLFVSISLISTTVSGSAIPSNSSEWSEILADHLFPWKENGISRELVDATFDYPGSHVIYQYLSGQWFMYDPEQHCLCNRSHDGSMKYDYHMRRCNAVISILEASTKTLKASNISIGDFEMVWSVDDLPFWNLVKTADRQQQILSNQTTKIIRAYPGFGAVRCPSKGALAFPFYGSHRNWQIDQYLTSDQRYSWRPVVSFEKRKGAVVFRGSLDRGCSIARDTPYHFDSNVALAPRFNETCGRRQLLNLSKQYPELIDYRFNSWISLENQSDTFRYVISIEGFAGWADRLEELLAGNMIVFNQEHPCDQWFEPLLTPYRDFIPVANDLSNLPGRILWANSHPNYLQRVYRSAKTFARQYLQREGILDYSITMLQMYSKLLKYKPERREGAIHLNPGEGEQRLSPSPLQPPCNGGA